jgi:uncharacterized protein YcfL
MKNINMVLIAALLLVTACASAEERAQKQAEREIAACTQKGIAPDTEAFDACRLKERVAAQKRREARLDNNDNFRPGTMPIQMYR